MIEMLEAIDAVVGTASLLLQVKLLEVIDGDLQWESKP
jgi:hypothetical protein